MLPRMKKKLLKADGITHILNITKEIPKQQYSGVTVCHLSCWDSPQQRLPFEEAAAFIDQCLCENKKNYASGGGNHKCLVHCNAGQSRSASIIIYYLMTKGHTLKQSYTYVKYTAQFWILLSTAGGRNEIARKNNIGYG